MIMTYSWGHFGKPAMFMVCAQLSISICFWQSICPELMELLKGGYSCLGNCAIIVKSYMLFHQQLPLVIYLPTCALHSILALAGQQRIQ